MTLFVVPQAETVDISIALHTLSGPFNVEKGTGWHPVNSLYLTGALAFEGPKDYGHLPWPTPST